MKTFQLVIDLVPYEVTEEELNGGFVQYTLPNFLGTDGLQFLKRRNKFGVAQGYTYDGLSSVELDGEYLIIITEPEKLEQVVNEVLEGYKAVGWECLYVNNYR